MRFSRLLTLVTFAGLATLGLVRPASAAPFVATTWGDNRVHILDASLNSTFSFPTFELPNGLATDGTTIWVGSFMLEQVNAYDFSGNLLYSWNGSFPGLQGMELVNGELAIQDSQGDVTIEFYNPVTGAFIRAIDSPGSTVEALAFDGTLLWALGAEVHGLDPLTGLQITSVANPASGCDFGGTALATAGPGQLLAGCADGSWFMFSSTTGAVSLSGNNGLSMFGLGEGNQAAPIPEPGTIALLGAGLAAAVRRRLRKS